MAYRNTNHLKFIASLPCLVTGHELGIQAHHLLRGGGKGMATKSPDNMTVPLWYKMHDRLHRRGDELAWFADMGIDSPMWVAERLFQLSGDHDAAYDFLQGFQDIWVKNWRRIK